MNSGNSNLINELKQLKDIYLHKKYLMDACYKMSEYFFKNGEKEKGLEVMRLGFTHDISKLNEEEFYGFCKIIDDTSCLEDAECTLSRKKEEIIKIHWNNNRHHPEYWDDINDMSEMDIIHMVCDWYARSLQYNTNVRDFVEKRQENRFNFPRDMYDKIIFYLNVLLE